MTDLSKTGVGSRVVRTTSFGTKRYEVDVLSNAEKGRRCGAITLVLTKIDTILVESTPLLDSKKSDTEQLPEEKPRN